LLTVRAVASFSFMLDFLPTRPAVDDLRFEARSPFRRPTN
jgi:hypothetical protein